MCLLFFCNALKQWQDTLLIFTAPIIDIHQSANQQSRVRQPSKRWQQEVGIAAFNSGWETTDTWRNLRSGLVEKTAIDASCYFICRCYKLQNFADISRSKIIPCWVCSAGARKKKKKKRPTMINNPPHFLEVSAPVIFRLNFITFLSMAASAFVTCFSSGHTSSGGKTRADAVNGRLFSKKARAGERVWEVEVNEHEDYEQRG